MNIKTGWDALGWALAVLVVGYGLKQVAEFTLEGLNALLDRWIRLSLVALSRYHSALTRAMLQCRRHARYDENTQEWVVRVPVEDKSGGFLFDLMRWEHRYSEDLSDLERIKRDGPGTRDLKDIADVMDQATRKRLHPHG